jgi:signal recognition particle receptor subunit beta
MALLNNAKREINAKLVYYGPGLSGKATNLNYIYRKLKPEHRGKLKTMNIGKDRMLFFDFAPSGSGKVGENDIRFHVYSIIGDTTDDTAWKMVLKGADGVIFVADSAPDRMNANLESLDNLKKIMRGYGMSIKDLPGVLQCNKRDIDTALSMEEMENALNYGCFTVMPAVAKRGEGVLNSILNLTKTVLKNLRESGLEPEKEPEQLAGLSLPATSGQEEPQVTETTPDVGESYSAIIPAVAVETETTIPVPVPEVAVAEGGDGPFIELAGEVVSLGGGRLRLPLNIKYGGLEKKAAITVSVSFALVPAD